MCNTQRTPSALRTHCKWLHGKGAFSSTAGKLQCEGDARQGSVETASTLLLASLDDQQVDDDLAGEKRLFDDLLEESEDVHALPESLEITVDRYDIEDEHDDAGFVPTTTEDPLSAAAKEWRGHYDPDPYEHPDVADPDLTGLSLDQYARQMWALSYLTQPTAAEWQKELL